MEKIEELQNSIDGLEITVNNLIDENEKLKTALHGMCDIIKSVFKYVGDKQCKP